MKLSATASGLFESRNLFFRVSLIALFALLHITVFVQHEALRNAAAITAEQSFQFYLLFAGAIGCSIVSVAIPKFRIQVASSIVLAGLGALTLSVIGTLTMLRVPITFVVLFSAAMSRSEAVVAVVVGLFLAFTEALNLLDPVWTQVIDQPVDFGRFVAVPTTAILALLMVLLIQLDREAERNRAKAKTLSDAVEELSKANLGYSMFVRFAEDQAMVEERNRITREIHDDIGYTLSNAMMLAQVAKERAKNSDPRMAESLDAIVVQTKTGLSNTRRSLRLLRSRQNSANQGVDGLVHMLSVYEHATGVKTEFNMLVPRRIVEHEEIFLTVYYFIQEGLTNAFRHGHATHVEVRLQRDDQWLMVVVRDNGTQAVENVEAGIGLSGMQERVASLGGSISYGPPDNQHRGFVVSARIPIQGKPQ